MMLQIKNLIVLFCHTLRVSQIHKFFRRCTCDVHIPADEHVCLVCLGFTLVDILIRKPSVSV